MKKLANLVAAVAIGTMALGCGGAKPPVYEPPVNTGAGGAPVEEDPTSDAGVATDPELMGAGAGENG
jgi:hypothetical protein